MPPCDSVSATQVSGADRIPRERQHLKQRRSGLGVRLQAPGPSNDTCSVSLSSRASRAALSVTARWPSMISTGLPTDGAVLVAGAVVIPTVTAEQARVERVVERVVLKTRGFGCSGGTFVWHRCR
jgi:hypothetical protein